MKRLKHIKNITKNVICVALTLMMAAVPADIIRADETNDKTDKAYDTVCFTVNLNVEGNVQSDNESFTFDLTRYKGEDAPLPVQGAQYAVMAAADEAEESDDARYIIINGDDSESFGPITFTSSGEYHYTITMRSDNLPENYTHDATVYDIVVMASYNEKGSIIASYYVTQTNDSKLKTQNNAVYTEEYGKEDGLSFITYYNTPVTSTTSEKETTGATTKPADKETTGTPTTPGDSDDSEIPTTPGTTGTKSGKGSLPKTGDDTDNLPWIILLSVAGSGAICCALYLFGTVKKSGRKGKR